MRIILAIVLAVPIAIACMIFGLGPEYGIVAGIITATILPSPDY